MDFRNKLLLAVLLSASSVHCMKRAGYTAIGCAAALHSTKRHCSSVEFQGKYVSSDSNGVITIKQENYPKYFGVHNLHLRPKILSEMMIDKDNDMPYQLVDYNDLNGPFEAIDKIEVVVDSNETFTISKPDQVEEKSYSSIGSLEFFYPKRNKGKSHCHGSAIAIDKNLAIAEAHNFLPAKFGNKPNTDRILAEDVRFHDMLTISRTSENTDIRSIGISIHCFIHPEWEKNFNPKYDVALVFLSDNINLTQKQIDLLQNMKIFNGTEETINIVNARNSHMSKYAGKEIWKQAINSKNIAYHLANTLCENPIIAEDVHVKTHTKDVEDGMQSNSAVKISSKLLPFLDRSIRLHQEFLDGMDQIKEMTKQTKQQREQEWMAQGEEAKTLVITKNLKAMNLPIDQIKSATGLTEEEIRKI